MCVLKRFAFHLFLFSFLSFFFFLIKPPRLSNFLDPSLRSTDDLKIVNNNVAMLTDMLGALGPDERVSDADVIGELHQACNEMRSRILSLIDSISNDDLLGCAFRCHGAPPNSPRPTSQLTHVIHPHTASFLVPMMP
jgi:hypothetical protein